MKTIELVMHCWRYSRVLNYLLSSLEINMTRNAQVRATIFCSPDDAPTWDVMNWFAERWRETHVSLHLRMNPWPLDLPQLLRRSIGRNLAATQTTADLVWFLDCDYVFGSRCLETLASLGPTIGRLYYPRTVLISKTHALGDALAKRAAAGPGIYTVHKSEFEPSKHRAIGGLQIVPGWVAREFGYCRNIPKHQRPVTDGKWKDTRGDMAFRKSLNTKGIPIELPNLFRIRQTNEGQVDTLVV